MSVTKQNWSAEDYAREGGFVASLAQPVVKLLGPVAGQRILDLGCGDGVLSAQLQAAGAIVLGVDSSSSMIEAARAAGINAQFLNMEQLPYRAEFDAVFSNAALHWVADQDAMLQGVRRALKPGGRFVAEMGGHGNIAALRTALRASLSALNAEELFELEMGQNFFPSPQAYHRRLVQAGFIVRSIELIPRPTELGAGGIKGWYRTFRASVLKELGEDRKETVLSHAERLLEPILRDEMGNWIADYVRLRFVATAS